MTPMPCPRCNGNGNVRLYEVAGSGERLRVCDECEAAWSSYGPLDAKHMQDLAATGVLDDWTRLREGE